MAEGLARAHAPATVQIVSAALSEAPVPPVAARVMSEIGIDLSRLSARRPSEVEVFSFDLVVTLGELSGPWRPDLAGMPPHVHWSIAAPDPEATEQELLESYVRARDELSTKVSVLFSSELLHGLGIAKKNLELVLDNLAHAVMAHTNSRRIFYFNPEAERLTGFSRDEVLGKDCHQVFKPRRFCGGDCLFCESRPQDAPRLETRTAEVGFTRKDEVERILQMTVRPLSDAEGAPIGALVSFADNTELSVLKRRVKDYHSMRGLVGRTAPMLALFDQIREVAAVNVPVLIEGESGTGKELVAGAIHEESARAGRPFVPINCGALPEGILESELFGHVRGAFTGALYDKRGRFELADGGTLFFDEVADLSFAMQVKLLRVLQEQCFERVGGERSIHVDVRVVSATNQNLKNLVQQKRFRRDLYYRLRVVPIVLPPLRERRADIPLLVDHFLEQLAKETGRRLEGYTSEALDRLVSYDWPGNVRELWNVVEYILVKCRSATFSVDHLPPEVTGRDRRSALPASKRGPDLKLNREQVLSALVQARQNKSKAAKLLGVGRTTLYRHLAAFDLGN
jgi:PAS domain S-box-containing protein